MEGASAENFAEHIANKVQRYNNLNSVAILSPFMY